MDSKYCRADLRTKWPTTFKELTKTENGNDAGRGKGKEQEERSDERHRIATNNVLQDKIANAINFTGISLA